MNDQKLTITQASQNLSVSTYAIRRLCNAGLIPHIKRNRKGYRLLEPWQVDLAGILLGMRQAGLTTKELRRYSRLYRQGTSTEAERLAILTTRKHQLQREIQDRQESIDFIERQEELFEQNHPRVV